MRSYRIRLLSRVKRLRTASVVVVVNYCCKPNVGSESGSYSKAVAFLLTSRLPSSCSASATSAVLFAAFSGTMQLSDFRLSFIIGVRLLLPDTARSLHAAGDNQISRFPINLFPHMHGVYDRAESLRHLPWRTAACCLRRPPRNSALRFGAFAAQYPTYAFPCQRFANRVTPASA